MGATTSSFPSLLIDYSLMPNFKIYSPNICEVPHKVQSLYMSKDSKVNQIQFFIPMKLNVRVGRNEFRNQRNMRVNAG